MARSLILGVAVLFLAVAVTLQGQGRQGGGRGQVQLPDGAGKEAVTVNGKTEQATKVSRTDGSKEIIAWIVPDMPVPVRILQRENGQDALDLTIKALR